MMATCVMPTVSPAAGDEDGCDDVTLNNRRNFYFFPSLIVVIVLVAGNLLSCLGGFGPLHLSTATQHQTMRRKCTLGLSAQSRVRWGSRMWPCCFLLKFQPLLPPSCADAGIAAPSRSASNLTHWNDVFLFLDFSFSHSFFCFFFVLVLLFCSPFYFILFLLLQFGGDQFKASQMSLIPGALRRTHGTAQRSMKVSNEEGSMTKKYGALPRA